ncbi:Cof-type HAD-IIB family hydrolase [Flavobacterium sp. TSSA_36]|uniref:Cof-type HAD-IIB family hydrolase n=1 Tax=Flavobacterium sp. TSSA_36 TaxID=3447669 RepID=UPI003F409F46
MSAGKKMKRDNQQPIKVIISDLDGTLLNANHQITPFTKKVFKKLHLQGYKIIIATGRHHLDAKAIVNELEIPFYLVTSNGARIHCPDETLLFSLTIDSQIIQSVFDLQIDPNITAVLFKETEWLTSKTNQKISSFQKDLSYPPRVVDFKKLKDFSAIKLFFTHDDHDVLVTLKEAIMKTHSDALSFAFSLPFCLEFMDKSIDKSMAIAKILVRESLTFDQTIAFGDGFNDEKMLQAVAKGLVMQNAPQNLKDQLRHLEVIGSNEEDAVAHYLNEMIFFLKKMKHNFF